MEGAGATGGRGEATLGARERLTLSPESTAAGAAGREGEGGVGEGVVRSRDTLLAGGLAGMATDAILHPIDTIKVR